MNNVPPMRLAFVGLLLLSGIGNLCLPAAVDAFGQSLSSRYWNLYDSSCGILSGLLIGEFLTIAFWILLEPISLLRKLLLGSCAGFCLSTSLVVGLQGIPQSFAIFTWVAGTLLPFAFAFFIWVWSVLFRIDVLPLKLGGKSSGEVQFGVRFLLFCMFAVATAIFLIRLSLPSNRRDWLSPSEIEATVLWFVWLVATTSLFAWIAATTMVRPTLFRVGAIILLTASGPVCFQFVASMILLGFFEFQFRLWEPLPYFVAIGILIPALIIGAICRVWRKTPLPPSPISNDDNEAPPSPQSPPEILHS